MSDLDGLQAIEFLHEQEEADTLSTVQRESREWRARAYPETRNIELQALGVCEEAGELAHAVLKYKQGIRGYDREKTCAEVADAIGDIVIYACGVADQLDIDVSRAVYKAWEHVRDRNITQGSDAGMGPSGVGCFPPVDDDDEGM
jgi:NTP pyrophosphatase (non-canonical NTP hydrolase)